MTTRRLIVSLTASAAALALAATFAVRSFPLEAQGRAPGTGAPIQVVKGGEHLLHGELPEYPHRAIEQKVEGDVVVDMTLNDRGEVSDARVLSGPEELRKATLEAVLQWHYSPSAVQSTATQATLRFQLPAAGLEIAELPKKLYAVESRGWAFTSPEHAEGPLKEIEMALENPATTDEQRVELKAKYLDMKKMIEKINADSRLLEDGKPRELDVEIEPTRLEFSGRENVMLKFIDAKNQLKQTFEGTPQLVQVRTERVSKETARELLAQAGVAVGDVITEETAKRILEIARAMDEHISVEFRKEEGGLILTILTR